MKRLFDIVASGLGLIVLSPLFLILAIWIKLDSKGPVFYRQVRVGHKNKDFRIFKFRSMRVGADKGSLVTIGGHDPRVTRSGYFIRKFKFDELPQLFNILKGDMSIVGNRPLPLYEAEKLTVDSSIDRFMAPAGLTGLWQVEERGKGGMMSAEERKQLDITYGQTYNFALDMKIIFRTLTAFIQKDNV